jgi:hypothetical protein
MIRSRARKTNRPGHPAGLLLGCLLSAAVLTGALAGCGPAPELGREAASQLQTQVLAVTGAAAANDPAGSLKLLDELVAKLDGAAARGEVSAARQQSIRTSIDAVRADLTAQQAAAEAARAAAEAEAARVAAAASAAASAPPAVAPAPANNAKPKAKGKGNG